MSTPRARGVLGVEGVLGVDEGGHAAELLGHGDDLEGEGGLAGGLGPVDLDDAPLRDAADAEGQVEGGRAGGDGGDVQAGLFSVMRMMAPLPNCFSIWSRVRSNALSRSPLTSSLLAMFTFPAVVEVFSEN